MRLELKDIKRGWLEQAYSCSLSDFPELIELAVEDGPEFSEPLAFQLRFQQTGKFVTVDGHFDAVVRLKCGRCLQRFEQILSESFALTFVPELKKCETEEEVELEVDDMSLIAYKDDILELQEPLQEQLLMSVPMNPVCSISCQGLCPECGLNLNREKCDCVKKPFNNKFTALADMNFRES